jgi:serine/threonine protein kinase
MFKYVNKNYTRYWIINNIYIYIYNHFIFFCTGDFGSAKIEKNQNFSSQQPVGTDYFIAPEIFDEKKLINFFNILLILLFRYTRKLDIWSLGVLLYYMMYGTYPYKKRKDFDKDITNLILNKPSYSEELKNLLKSLLSKVCILCYDVYLW